jgi:hypothetical protein
MSVLHELAAVIGMPGAKAVCSMWGGTRWYVSREPSIALIELIGEQMAARLCARFAGEELLLPVPDLAAARRGEVLRLHSEHLLCKEIAKRVGLTERRVRQIVFSSAGEGGGSVSP